MTTDATHEELEPRDAKRQPGLVVAGLLVAGGALLITPACGGGGGGGSNVPPTSGDALLLGTSKWGEGTWSNTNPITTNQDDQTSPFQVSQR